MNVVLDVGKAGPRAVEDATRNRITADYRFAWTGIAQALEANTMGPLQGVVIGNAKAWLSESVSHPRIAS